MEAGLFHDRQRKIKPCHSHGNGNPPRAEPLTLRAWIPGRALRDLPGMTMGLFFPNNETALLGKLMEGMPSGNIR
jgi:hypothetical protein